MNWWLVLIGAALGAPARYLTDRCVQARHSTGFPWGTFIVNITGSLLLGVTLTAMSPAWQALVGTGFCGALTTYSTFAYEVVSLADERRIRDALGYPILSVVAGLSAAWLGMLLAR